MFTDFDKEMMQKALDLAYLAKFSTSPNPMVGCVITFNNEIIGLGYHKQAGTNHAEVQAINDALTRVKSLKGAKAYVTLEPCSHFGRTPPCALNLIKHEFKEVVIAMKDPNPIVAGSGIKLLEEAGIKVKIGLLEAEAKKLNKFYIANILNKKPFITLKLATSIDGKIQDQYGDSKWISSAKSRSDVQLSRALSMAILSSSQSIIMDDARLSIREDEIKLNLSKNYTKFQESLSLKNEIKIILDKDSKLTGYEKIFSTKGDIYIVSLEENELIKKHSNVKFIKAKLTNGQIDLNKLIDSIYKLGINSIFIECGSILATSFLKENLVDELHIYQAPFFLGKLAKNMVGFDDIKISAKKEFILNNVQTFCNDIKVVYTLKNYM